MAAIFKRELRGYFDGMTGYVVIAAVAAFIGLLFAANNLLVRSPDFASVLYYSAMILLFVVPALTMRSFAEDRRSKADQLLLTAPVSIPAIVLGKYLAQVAVLGTALVLPAAMPLVMAAFGTVALGAQYAALLAFFLLGMACIAVGTWLSALTENLLVAYFSTFGLLMAAYMMHSIQSLFTGGGTMAFISFSILLVLVGAAVGFLCKSMPVGCLVFTVGAAALVVLFRWQPAWLTTAFYRFLEALALFAPLEDFVGGVFNLGGIVYYFAVITFFLFLTGQALEKRRWS